MKDGVESLQLLYVGSISPRLEKILGQAPRYNGLEPSEGDGEQDSGQMPKSKKRGRLTGNLVPDHTTSCVSGALWLDVLTLVVFQKSDVWGFLLLGKGS